MKRHHILLSFEVAVLSIFSPSMTGAHSFTSGSFSTLPHSRHFQPSQQSEATFASNYTPPPDRGTPPSDKTTGSRGDCFYDASRPPLAALVGKRHLSWTISDRPTIWFYNPYSASEVFQAELVIQSETSDEEIYRGTFPLAPDLGIQGIRLPQSMKPLSVGATYRWYIDVMCEANPTQSSATTSPATLTGVIERVETPEGLEQSLESISETEAIALYGQHHLWYDMLTQLARLRLERPGDRSLQQLWQDLLRDETNVGLEFLSQERLLSETAAE